MAHVRRFEELLREPADGDDATPVGQLRHEAGALVRLGTRRRAVRAGSALQVRVRRHDVPEEHVVREPELGEDALHDRGRRLAGRTPGDLALGGEGQAAHSRPAVPGRLTDQQKARAVAGAEILLEPRPPDLGALAVTVEVERRPDPGGGEIPHEALAPHAAA
jgi:hypothetical protein